MKLQNERLLLLTLAAIQFTTNLDFLIILPLGPQYMRVMDINPAQFNLIVAAYALAAGISGVAAGFFLDRFDRKTALLWLFLGFALGTLLCALAPTYHLLVAARTVAGAFGGVSGALILAIIGDVIPEERRGEAMGLVMSSFSVASIVGVPMGLVFASKFSWHVPFFAIAGISVPILLATVRSVPSLRGHLRHAPDVHPAARMWAVLIQPSHQMAFVFMAVLTCAGFAIFPNLATYMVYNVHLTEHQLPLIYLAGGLCTLFSMNWIGRWADRAGKGRVFTVMSLCASGSDHCLDEFAARAAGGRAGHVHPADDLHVGPVRSGDGDDHGDGGIALPGRLHERQFIGATILLRPGVLGERAHRGPGAEQGNHPFSHGGNGLPGLRLALHLAGAIPAALRQGTARRPDLRRAGLTGRQPRLFCGLRIAGE